jgi:hypothetical protein
MIVFPQRGGKLMSSLEILPSVVERVMPVTEVHALCMSMGASSSGVACEWVDRGTCFIILPSDEQAPVPVYRRHEIAHCNGWPANHPHDDG